MVEAGVKKAATTYILRLAWGTILAAAAMYVTGMLYWREWLPNTAVSKVYDENDFIQVLQASFPQSGTYTIPGPDDHVEGIRELRKTGPLATLHVLNRRNIPSKNSLVLYRIIQLLLTAGIIGWLAGKLPPGRRYLRSRVISIALMGLAAAIYNDLADSLWSYHPWSWSLAKAGYDLVSWTAAGLILALDRFHPSEPTQPKPDVPASGSSGV